MPDLLRDEETETRTHSLCLFNVSGITRTNRCENCPGVARTRALYQQRRCPLDVDFSEQNIFSPVGAAAEGKSEAIDTKLLGTSSKLPHGPDAVAKISDTIAGISLDKTARKYVRRTRSDPGICNPSTDMSVSFSPVDIGVKRKADHEAESSLRNELADVYIAHNAVSHDQTEAVQNATSNKLGVLSSRDGSSDISAERMQQNKHPKLSQGPLVEGSDAILADVPDLFNSLTIRADGSPVHTEDYHSDGDMTISDSHVDIGIELKEADSWNQPENSFRAELAAVIPELNDPRPKFKDGSSDVMKYLRDKPQVIFQDLPRDEPPFLEQSWGVYTAVPASWSSLFNGFDTLSPNIMQEDHHFGRASSFGICIPGIGAITGQGVPPSNDGIFNRYDPKEGGLMLAKEISELSIDQIEERRIEGSSFL